MSVCPKKQIVATIKSSCDEPVYTNLCNVDDITQPIVEAIQNNTTVLKAELDEMQSAVTSTIQEVITTIDDGIEVTATQAGTWEVTVSNPTTAEQIAEALQGLDVNIAGQDGAVAVTLGNETVTVEVANFPVIPKDVEHREVCAEYLDGNAPETYNTWYGYSLHGTWNYLFDPTNTNNSHGKVVNSYLLAVYNINGDVVRLPVDEQINIIKDGQLVLTPQEWLDAWYTTVSKYNTSIEPKDTYKVSDNYIIFTENVNGFIETYVTINTYFEDGSNGTFSTNILKQTTPIQSVGNQTTVTGKTIQHIIYDEVGQISSTYLTSLDGETVLTGKPVECADEFANTNSLLTEIRDKKDYEYVVLYDKVDASSATGEQVSYDVTASNNNYIEQTAIDLTNIDKTKPLLVTVTTPSGVQGEIALTSELNGGDTLYYNVFNTNEETSIDISNVVEDVVYLTAAVPADITNVTVTATSLPPQSSCTPFIRRYEDETIAGDFALDGTAYTVQGTVATSCGGTQDVNVTNEELTVVSDNANNYVEYTDIQTITGTNIVVTFYEGTGNFTLNSTNYVSLNADRQYRSEPMDGTVVITPDAGAKYHVSWRA